MTHTSPASSPRRPRRLAGVLFAATLLFAACGDDDTDVGTDGAELPTNDDLGDETRPAGSGEDFGPAGEPIEGGDASGTRPAGSGEDFGPAGEPEGGQASGMCLEGDPACDDTVSASDCPDDAPDCEDTVDHSEDSQVDEGARIREAEALIGTPEDELTVGSDLRIGRRGAESYALTEDYRIGRFTVELDEQDGTFVVTRITIELTEGPMVVED